MLSRHDLAKELIRRRDRPTAQARQCPQPSSAAEPTVSDGNTSAMTSYEMVDQHLAITDEGDRQQQRQRFWRLGRRAHGDEQQDGDINHRVVSEPVNARGTKTKMLERLRLRRGSSDAGAAVQRGERDENVTIVTETDERNYAENQAAAFSFDVHSKASTPGVSRGHASDDNSPSFISFSPASVGTSTPSRSRVTSSPGQIGSASRRTLAPAFTTPARSAGRAAAVRAISLEARLADTSLDTPSSTDAGAEYPSLVDSSSTAGPRGILRPKNTRVPPNTPTPTVRFADTWLTGIKPLSKEPRLERAETLPPAQISGGPRWKRLGALLGAVERVSKSSDPVDAGSGPHAPISIAPLRSPRSLSSSSDSPISFARFDRDEHVSHSTPVRRQRRRDNTPTPGRTPDTISLHSAGGLVWSDEEAVFEPCSAIEALWEYGSSGSDEAAVDVAHSAHTPLSTWTDDVVGLASLQRHEHILVTPPTTSTSVNIAPPRRTTLEERRESRDLIPLKYRGGSFDAAAQSDPFPFATALKF